MRSTSACPFAVLFLALAPALPAQDTPEAWLARLAAISSRPVSLHQAMAMNLPGAQVSGEGDGIFLDETHFALRMDTETFWPNGEGADDDVRRAAFHRSIGDGAKLWNEIGDPLTGRCQVQSLGFDQVAVVSKSELYQGKTHPIQQLLKVLDLVEPDRVEVAEGVATLICKFTEEGKARLVPQFRGSGVPKELVIVLDAETSFPRSWTIRGFRETMLRMDFTKVEFLDPEKVDRETFVFHPSGEAAALPGDAAAPGQSGGENG